jgi:N4-gp56 family major capsid protein
MSTPTVNYASKFSPLVDEAFTMASLTNGLFNNNYSFEGVSSVNVYSIPTAALNNYSTTGSGRYGTPSELTNEVQTLTMSQDKSFTFTIDRKSEQDTMGVMEAAKALAREIREVVIPTLDTYRITTIAGAAPSGHVITNAVTASNAYSEFLDAQEKLDEAKAPTGGRVALVTPKYYNLIKKDDSFTKRGDEATQISLNGYVGTIDGVPVVKVPSSYFPANTDFIITNAIAAIAPVKLQDYKIHVDPPGINGFLVEGRIRHDCFVLNKKKNAIVVHTHTASQSGSGT